MASVAILLEDRVCQCGCGLQFRTMPNSKQVFARAACSGKTPQPAWAIPRDFPTKEERATKSRSVKAPPTSVRMAETAYQANDGVLPEPIRLREEQSKQRPRSGGSWKLEWDRCVKEARTRILEMNRNRMLVAGLAIEACDIVKGGGNHWKQHKGVKTLKSFALEVGISYKTLHTWVEIKKKVVDQLPEGVYDESNFGAAYRTMQRGRRSKDFSPERMGKFYDGELERVGSSHGILQILKTMRAAANRLELLDLALCADDEKLALKQIADRVSARLEKSIYYKKGKH